MALAQDTDLIFLDEPTAYLDPSRQFELLDLVAELNRRGKTVVTVLHELSHALTRSHRVVLLEDGRLVAQGTPEEIVSGGAIEQVFRVRIHRAEDTYYITP